MEQPNKAFIEILDQEAIAYFNPEKQLVSVLNDTQSSLTDKLQQLNLSQEEVHFLLDAQSFSLVPEKLFDAAVAPRYLELHQNNLEEAFVSFEILDFAPIELVFAFPKSTAQTLHKFSDAAYLHFKSKPLLEWTSRFGDNTTFPSNIWFHHSGRQMSLSIFQKGRLVFHNIFKTNTWQDQLYYIIALIEQQQIQAEQTALHLLGDGFSETLIQNLKKQFENITQQKNLLEDEKPEPSFIHLEAAYLCASSPAV